MSDLKKLSLTEKMAAARSEADVKNIFQNHFGLKNVNLDWVDLMTPGIFFEAKKEQTDIYKMLAQLILTIHQRAAKIETLPEYIGGFDNEKCGIIEFDDLYQKFETYNDMNWNQTPSSVDDKTVNLARAFCMFSPPRIYNYATDEKELAAALRDISDSKIVGQKRVDANNFVSIFLRFERELKDNINIDFGSEYAKQAGLTLGDFYLADLMTDNDTAIDGADRLKIRRYGDEYKSNITVMGTLLHTEYKILDMTRHTAFWNKYRRPPKPKYCAEILSRRDLLVPAKIREVKGAFFTPRIWVEKSQDYMARALGDDFHHYAVWDCAAGTGNLLVGLPQDRGNIFASTLDESDVQIMKQSGNLYENNIFQFDFLNDAWKCAQDGGKIPDALWNIMYDKTDLRTHIGLIVYINPPYAEMSFNKAGVSKNHLTYRQYGKVIGKAGNELFIQFMARIYDKLPNAYLGQFSTLKFVAAPNFSQFRKYFQAKYMDGFVVRADTFDNVAGQFPIGFTIWNLRQKQPITNISCDILDNDGKIEGEKTFYIPVRLINDWIKTFNFAKNDIGGLNCKCTDFQQQKWILINHYDKLPDGFQTHLKIDESNLTEAVIYLAVRLAIDATWLNDRDQFLSPSMRAISGEDGLMGTTYEYLYESDKIFKNNCLMFTIFNSQNRISSADGTNHWIPFTEFQAGSRRSFDSRALSDFVAKNITPDTISKSAMDVWTAGLNLWRYYFVKIGEADTSGAPKSYNQNASFYDIKEFFKGRAESKTPGKRGRMNNKSADAKFNELESALSAAMKILARDIEPKIYEYGFLKK